MSEAITSYVRALIAADYSVRTVDASAGDLGQFAAFLSARGIHVPGQITRADISAFAEALAEGTLVSPDQERKNGPSRGTSPPAGKPRARSTIARKLSVVRRFLRFCEDTGLLQASPAAGTVSPKFPKRLPQVLNPAQVDLLLRGNRQRRNPLELRDRALFELIYSSGLRCQEVLDLGLRDISAGSCEVRVKGKGRKVRVVPVGDIALAALDRYLREGRPCLVRVEAEDHVFVSRRGRPLSSSDVRRRLARYLRGGWVPQRARRPTPSATRSPPTYSREVPTCGSSRKSSGIPRCALPRSTRMFPPHICAEHIARPIPGPDNTR